jgi:uncharacterized membrane protein
MALKPKLNMRICMETTAPQAPSSSVTRTQRWLPTTVVLAAIVVIGAWLWKTPSGVQGKADAVGYAICHRIADRSFSAYDRQLPLCARCTGIYSGAMTGLAVMVASGRSRATRFPGWRIWLVFGLFVLWLGVDGINSYLHLFPDFEGGLYEPSNTLRLITGVFFGLVLINALYPVFNAAVWQDQDRRTPIADFKELVGYCLAAALVIAAMLTENPFVLLVFGLASGFGVLLVLTLIMSILFITLTRHERSYSRWRELWLPFLAGLTLAVMLVGGIDAVRYLFTGTWDGFVFTQR